MYLDNRQDKSGVIEYECFRSCRGLNQLSKYLDIYRQTEKQKTGLIGYIITII